MNCHHAMFTRSGRTTMASGSQGAFDGDWVRGPVLSRTKAFKRPSFEFGSFLRISGKQEMCATSDRREKGFIPAGGLRPIPRFIPEEVCPSLSLDGTLQSLSFEFFNLRWSFENQ